ncbi:MAG: hypothetical protein QGG05_15990 [Candidatus Latescibacteria bacterium]|nr:hypothetical protein [Candidatus Latescibacterota bacterium]
MSASFLEARRVRMEFGGGLFERQRLVAVQGASLQLPADRPVVVAIAGESGSGKTTLARHGPPGHLRTAPRPPGGRAPSPA